MGDSNSIKKVLPAILNGSAYLKSKYSKPIYGSLNGISSKNFSERIWIEMYEQGLVKDPYKLLLPLFFENDDSKLEAMYEDLGICL